MTDTQTETRRGRPRPQEVIQRDDKVLEYLRGRADGATREQLAQALGLETKQVYLSLYRLRVANQATRERGDKGAHVWKAKAT